MDSSYRSILRNAYNNIVILSGAGVSTSAGIPDYRSPRGVFSQLAKAFPYMRHPGDIFNRSFMLAHPEVENHPVLCQFRLDMMDAEPTASHNYAAWLHKQGRLKRVYTQNIDELYQKAGLPSEMVVEFHGSLSKGVVMYEDPIPASTLDKVCEDFIKDGGQIDLVIVMGTSLKVAPFSVLPNMVPKKCHRILIDKYPEHLYGSTRSGSAGTIGFRHSDRSLKIPKRIVTLKQQWVGNSKWMHQYIFKEDLDTWCDTIMNPPAELTKDLDLY